MFTRRGFIRLGAAGVGSLALRPFGLLPALAQNGPDYRALVCIFLFGGNDANNMIVPADDTSYQQYLAIRGNLALATADLTAPVTAKNGAPYSFHAKLAELSSLFGSSELAVVANVGSLIRPVTRSDYVSRQAPLPSNLFSHSDQQLEWQSSIAQGNSPTGWAGRAADIIESQNINSSKFPTFFSVAGNALMGAGAHTSPVTLTPGTSLQLQGFNNTNESNARLNALTSLLTLDTGMALAQTANNTVADSRADAKALSKALSNSTTLNTKFPTTGLGAQLQQVAQVIQVREYLGMRRQIFFCSLGGFDTHTDELNTHNTLYPQLSQAIAAFYNAVQEIGVASNVTTFTESDFSRTFLPTSGLGSDHAWGSHHLVLGGAVQGGQIFGSFPTFDLGDSDDADTRGRWIPTTSIDQYGATLCSWFGIADRDLATVFPNLSNFKSSKLSFLG
jgi:uncharacterized protein (DUF1501 family)